MHQPATVTNLCCLHTQLLAHLSESGRVNLGGVNAPWEGEEVGGEVLLEPRVLPDALDGYTLHWVHLQGKDIKVGLGYGTGMDSGLKCGKVLCLHTIHVAGYGPTNKLNEH